MKLLITFFVFDYLFFENMGNKWKKSELVPIGRVYSVEFVFVLGCSVGEFPYTYLCLSLGASFKLSMI